MVRPWTHRGPWLSWWRDRRVWLLLTVAAVVVRSAWVRAGGLNPRSLWTDDLVYAAIIKNSDLLESLSVPIHVAPGLFLIWRWLYASIPDLELALQSLPFVCALAAIPVMAVVVRKLTNDDTLAACAAAVTALNGLLVRYSTFVHQYSFEFLAIALVLWMTIRLYEAWPAICPWRFMQVAGMGGVLLFFAVPSVFLTFPIVIGTAGYVVVRARGDAGITKTRATLVAASYGAAVAAAYVLLRDRSNADIRASFGGGFMQIDSLAAIWEFLAGNGRRMLQASLPRMEGGLPPWDGTFVWLMPLLGLGLIWLMGRAGTRPFGLAVVGFYLVFLAASALRIFPLGVPGGRGRTDIFASPVGICLLMAGLQCATDSLSRVFRFRAAAAVAIVALALWSPHHAPYSDMRTAALIDYVAVSERPDDGLILSYPAGFVAAVYGPWPFRISGTPQVHNGTVAEVERPRTLQMPVGYSSADDETLAMLVRAMLRDYLAAFRPDRIWFVAYRPGRWEVLEALEEEGYLVRDVPTEARDGRLYLALALSSRRDMAAPTEGRTPIGVKRSSGARPASVPAR